MQAKVKVLRSALMFIVPATEPKIVAQQLFAIECDNAALRLSGSEGGDSKYSKRIC
jgi:hypothetical protein